MGAGMNRIKPMNVQHALRLQTAAPEKKLMGNWLPIPQGKFNLFLRSYLPEQALIDPIYVPPAVRHMP